MIELFGHEVPIWAFPIAAAGIFSLGMLIGVITKIIQVNKSRR